MLLSFAAQVPDEIRLSIFPLGKLPEAVGQVLFRFRGALPPVTVYLSTCAPDCFQLATVVVFVRVLAFSQVLLMRFSQH